MEEKNQNSLKKSSNNLGLWTIIVPLFAICCAGPIVFLALISGGLTSLLGFFKANGFLIFTGILISLLAVAWLIAKVILIKGKNG